METRIGTCKCTNSSTNSRTKQDDASAWPDSADYLCLDHVIIFFIYIYCISKVKGQVLSMTLAVDFNKLFKHVMLVPWKKKNSRMYCANCACPCFYDQFYLTSVDI